MAITDNGTAIEVQMLLEWLLPSLTNRCGRGGHVPSQARAMLAAERLAEAAYKRMGAGPPGAAVRTAAALDSVRLAALDYEQRCA